MPLRYTSSWNGNALLENDDPEIYALIRQEKERQRNGLELIASEVSTNWILIELSVPFNCVIKQSFPQLSYV